jgi:osmotically-inducible protein OsmY
LGWSSERENIAMGGSMRNHAGMMRDREGRFAGRGPKGYRRSDERIQEDVSDRLTEESDIDASEIEIEVKEGEVILAGQVSDRNQKRRAEDCISDIRGVRDVSNKLRVKRSGGEETEGIERSSQKQQSQTQSQQKQQRT